MQNTVHHSSSELMSSEVDLLTETYPECTIAFWDVLVFFWTQRILNEGKGPIERRKKIKCLCKLQTS